MPVLTKNQKPLKNNAEKLLALAFQLEFSLLELNQINKRLQF